MFKIRGQKIAPKAGFRRGQLPLQDLVRDQKSDDHDQQTPRRGLPLRRPARIAALAALIEIYMGSLAQWMALVRSDADGRYETPAWCSVRLW